MSQSLVYNPKNLSDLDAILAGSAKKVKYIAGATDLMVQNQSWYDTPILIDLTGVHELSNVIDIGRSGIKIGAAVPMSHLIAHPVINEKYPMLVEACRQIGSVQIQNRATLGGNIANASPAGDTLPVLTVYDAQILIGPANSNVMEKRSLEDLMQGPGQTILSGNQYIAFIFLPYPVQKNHFWYFRKVGMRHAMAISKVSLAVLGWKKKDIITDIQICAGSVAPRIERARETERIIREKILTKTIIKNAGEKILDEIDPINDIRSTRPYRQRTCQALLKEALTELGRMG